MTIIEIAAYTFWLGLFAYIVFFHSRRRWPQLNTWQRYVRIITFQR